MDELDEFEFELEDDGIDEALVWGTLVAADDIEVAVEPGFVLALAEVPEDGKLPFVVLRMSLCVFRGRGDGVVLETRGGGGMCEDPDSCWPLGLSLGWF